MNRTRSIVKQASILALAGIFVRIIGVLYRSPLTELITTEGMGYYSTAYTVYAMILLISSYSIPSAISKLISEKLIVNQYNNVQKILKCSFIYICAIGGGAAIVTFFLAPIIVTKDAALALQVLCPTIFLSGLLGVFRGYFQAHQTTVYTSISQIIEQVFNAVVSIGAAYLFIQPYLATGGTQLASVGAAGSALGTGAGVLVGLAFMAFMFMKRKNNLIIKTDHDDYEDSYKDIFRMILKIVTPIIFATCIYNLVSTIDMYLLYFVMGDSVSTATSWGLYAGQYIILQNVPVALASAMSTAAIPAISSLWSIKDKKQTREQITSGIRVTMLILIPSAIGMSVLAYPIMGMIFPQKETIQTSTALLMFGSPAIIFFGLSTLTNGILQAIGEVNIPLKNAGSALIWHCILVTLLLFFTPLGLYSLIIGNCTYGLHVCVLNQIALRKKVRFKQEIRRTYILPLLASIMMGIVVAGCYFGLFALTKKVFIPLIISIIVGVIVYFTIILYLYADHPKELEAIPYLNRLVYKIKKH
ncbi:MAG: polysaccharide biosynthesis protein [Coprobacillus sp.]